MSQFNFANPNVYQPTNQFDISAVADSASRLQVFNDCVKLNLAEGNKVRLIIAVRDRLDELATDKSMELGKVIESLTHKELRAFIKRALSSESILQTVIKIIGESREYYALRETLFQLLAEWQFDHPKSACVTMVDVLGFEETTEVLNGLFVELFKQTAEDTPETDKYFQDLSLRYPLDNLKDLEPTELEKLKLEIRNISRRDALKIAGDNCYHQYMPNFYPQPLPISLPTRRQNKKFIYTCDRSNKWINQLIDKSENNINEIGIIGQAALYLKEISVRKEDGSLDELFFTEALVARKEFLGGVYNRWVLTQLQNWCEAIETPSLVKDMSYQIQNLLDQIFLSAPFLFDLTSITNMLAHLELNQPNSVN